MVRVALTSDLEILAIVRLARRSNSLLDAPRFLDATDPVDRLFDLPLHSAVGADSGGTTFFASWLSQASGAVSWYLNAAAALLS